ncbi:MAG: BadM/Rrf2 family transcriptional regulator [Hyphomicrobiales bacterium]|nr:MAG: BadM/Rrf2 family transcriptional regulator [Hyphomicrobiales bacterium]
MRLTVYTDYAIRLLIYLGLREGSLSTIEEVARAYGISRNHLMKIAHKLGQAGFVETVRGRGGGLRLAPEMLARTLGDLIRETEDDLHLAECFDAETSTCLIRDACYVQPILAEALDAYLTVLDRYTLGDVIAAHRSGAHGLTALLFPDLVVEESDPPPRPSL